MSEREREMVAVPGGGLGVGPDAWWSEGKAAWRLELIRRGWRRCPDGIWRMPADWPALRQEAA